MFAVTDTVAGFNPNAEFDTLNLDDRISLKQMLRKNLLSVIMEGGVQKVLVPGRTADKKEDACLQIAFAVRYEQPVDIVNPLVEDVKKAGYEVVTTAIRKPMFDEGRDDHKIQLKRWLVDQGCGEYYAGEVVVVRLAPTLG